MYLHVWGKWISDLPPFLYSSNKTLKPISFIPKKLFQIRVFFFFIIGAILTAKMPRNFSSSLSFRENFRRNHFSDRIFPILTQMPRVEHFFQSLDCVCVFNLWQERNLGAFVFEAKDEPCSWVRIPAPDTGWTWYFFTFICCKNCIVCLKKTENKRKRGWGWPIF